ncbi:hypothetical protein BSKO_10833 [Bryopsis sp. KO-2023]|nr:hypothetical protein BSKO_10833 [Bryopsis sp. KO-2023]
MSKLLAAALLVVVLSTVGVLSRPVPSETDALATEWASMLGYPFEDWCEEGKGIIVFHALERHCYHAGGDGSYTGKESQIFVYCCTHPPPGSG